MRLLPSVLVIGLALAVAACGGGDGAATGTESAASVAPADAPLYASINTDFDSDQWDQLNAVLERFPGRSRLVALFREALAEEDIDVERDLKPALGPTVELVVLDFEDDAVVGLTQPKDEEKLKSLLAKGDEPAVTREVDGWTAIAETDAILDRFERETEGESLADNDDFSAAMAELPEETLATVYVNGERATEALRQSPATPEIPERFGRFVAASFALEAEDNGVRVVGFSRTEGAEYDVPEVGALVEEVPAGAYAFASFHGYNGQLNLTDFFRDTPNLQPALGQVENALGVRLEELTSLFNREGVLYLRPGAVIPEVTLVLQVDSEQQAVSTVDRLARSARQIPGVTATPRPRAIGGVQAKELSFGRFSIFYAGLDGRLVVTTQEKGIADVDRAGDKLVDEERYERALEAAGVEEGEDVFFYLDFEETLGLADQLARLGDQPLPNDARANLEPLRSLVASGELGREDTTYRLFLEVE